MSHYVFAVIGRTEMLRRKRNMKKLAVILGVFVLASVSAFANGTTEEKKEDVYPKKTVEIVCTFSPGGDSDYNARSYASRLTKELGSPFVVVNVTGNGGATGATDAYRAKNDGYKAVLLHSALFVNKAMGSTDFGLEGFEVACILGKNPGNVVVVSSKSPYKTLKDLIDASKAKPGEITFAANVGGTTQVMGMLLNAAGGKLNLVDMGDTGERVASLLGGHVDAMPNALGSVIPYLESGDMRALALLEEERNDNYNDIPTAVEQGYEGCVLPIYYFLAFPKGTPQAIIDTVANACEKISQQKEYQDAIYNTYGQTPFFIKGPEATTFLQKLEKNVLNLIASSN
jgi:tripartite-type tricarboxylate transporter receptor subunit TctC